MFLFLTGIDQRFKLNILEGLFDFILTFLGFCSDRAVQIFMDSGAGFGFFALNFGDTAELFVV